MDSATTKVKLKYIVFNTFQFLLLTIESNSNYSLEVIAVDLYGTLGRKGWGYFAVLGKK